MTQTEQIKNLKKLRYMLICFFVCFAFCITAL
uniref:Uncharacterized protein n=1 Tax=Anguilla anguilla TaxID=7936 RepID=A0A0E9PMJ0_ANGAN